VLILKIPYKCSCALSFLISEWQYYDQTASVAVVTFIVITATTNNSEPYNFQMQADMTVAACCFFPCVCVREHLLSVHIAVLFGLVVVHARFWGCM
jgi:hypothetical protein